MIFRIYGTGFYMNGTGGKQHYPNRSRLFIKFLKPIDMKNSNSILKQKAATAALVVVLLAIIFLFIPSREPGEKHEREPAVEPLPVGLEAEPSPAGWKPLFNGHNLDGWEITNFGPQGPVMVRDSSIILNFGDGATGITWRKEFPVINYEISLKAMRVDGNDFFCGLTFPVNDQYCTFIVGGWGGSLVGLSSIDGMDASENFTSVRRHFENGRWYDIMIRVTADAIECFIDGEQFADVPVEPHTFSIRPEVGLSRPLGIASWVTTSALRDIRFRELEGS